MLCMAIKFLTHDNFLNATAVAAFAFFVPKMSLYEQHFHFTVLLCNMCHCYLQGLGSHAQ